MFGSGYENCLEFGQLGDTDNTGHNTQNHDKQSVKPQDRKLKRATRTLQISGMNLGAIKIVSKLFLVIVRFSNSIQHG